MQEEPRQRDAGFQTLLAIDQENRVERLQKVFILLERLQRVGHGRLVLQGDELGVHQAAGSIFFEFKEFADLGFRFVLHLLEDFLAGFRAQFRQGVGGLIGAHLLDNVGGGFGFEGFEDAGLNIGLYFRQRVGGHFAVDVLKDGFAVLGRQFLDDIRQVGRMHVFEQAVRDVQAQAALRVRLNDVAKFPTDGIRRDAALDTPDQPRRRDALQQAAENTADADVDFEHPELVAAVLNHALKGDVVDAHHLAPLRVDNLLVEKIADHPEHVFVGVIGRQILVAEVDPFEGDGADLIVADGKPGGAGPADQEAVNANRIDERDDRGILDHADPAPLKVKNLEAHKFGEEQKLFRHRAPGSIVEKRPNFKTEKGGQIDPPFAVAL